MRNVLIVDCPLRLGDLIKDKLAEDKLEVNFAQGKLDSVTRMINLLPDLAIVYISKTEEEKDIIEYLTRVHSDLNASHTPLIAIGSPRNIHQITDFARLGIRKYFIKPFKFDLLFYCIENILGMRFMIDRTQAIFDFHVNGNILFVEVSRAINREKVTLLSYQMTEVIDYLNLQLPYIVLMISNIDLSYVDGVNVECLLDTISHTKRVIVKNIKIITNNLFVKELIAGHSEYSSIEVFKSAKDLVPTINAAELLIKGKSCVPPRVTNDQSPITDILCEKLFSNTLTNFKSEIDMRFSFDDTRVAVLPIMSKSEKVPRKVFRIAVVDSNNTILDNFAQSFRAKGFGIDTFNDGALFMQVLNTYNGKKTADDRKYDLVVLNLTMKSLGGFSALLELRQLSHPPTIFVYTPAVPREIVIKAIACGAKQYFVRPQTPDDIVMKAMEILSR